MNKIDDGGPVAPNMITKKFVDENIVKRDTVEAEGGLSIRDYFAAAAMQSLAPNVFADAQKYGRDPKKALIQLVDGSFAIADAMLAARKEGV